MRLKLLPVRRPPVDLKQNGKMGFLAGSALKQQPRIRDNIDLDASAALRDVNYRRRLG